MTIQFYDQNGEKFFSQTKNLDMAYVYEPFLALLPKGALILDAGCGSGRDAKAFSERGYKVTAFDASETLVKLARENTGLDVQQMTFAEMDFEDAFDGIWTCATLLHVPHGEMDGVFQNIIRALKTGGVWYLSFKVGQGEARPDGRLFSYFDSESLRAFLSQYPLLEIVRMWETDDLRPELTQRWLNALVRKIKQED